MPLIPIIAALFVVAIVYLILRRLLPVFGIGEPWPTIIALFLVLFIVVWAFGLLGVETPFR